jgi:iron(III) transport system permease protein
VRWLAPLPLALPPYVGALAYQTLLAPGGLLAGWLAVPASISSRLIYGPAGAAWVLTLCLYPYVYLMAAGALARSNPSLEEAAQAGGLGPWGTAVSVTLPLLRPAVLGGALLVFLYVWADFGVVSLLRVRTLTTVIYGYVHGTLEWGTPAALSLVLALITGSLLACQRGMLGSADYSQVGSGSRRAGLVHLGRWRPVALAFAVCVLGMSWAVPLAVLLGQAARLGPVDLMGLMAREWPAMRNSLAVAATGACLITAVAILAARLTEPPGRQSWLPLLFQIGYATPGTVLGLGMVGFFQWTLPWVYGHPAILVLGYLVLFVTPALQAVRAAFAQISRSLEEAARGLGRTSLRTFMEVTLPLSRPGLLAGWTLVFILCMRELAASLILRPPGFDTLAVRIWIRTMDVGPDPCAAFLALLLVGLVALPWLALAGSDRPGWRAGTGPQPSLAPSAAGDLPAAASRAAADPEVPNAVLHRH